VKRPFEVNSTEYPFEDHWLPLSDGYVHYLDEGKGSVVLLLHGNPAWSYMYRDVIKELRGECRLIAPDYPGFGMSRAPSGYGFTPKEHSAVVADMVRHLNLRNLVLVVNDWGGPVGMGYAVDDSKNISGLVIMNTWAWPSPLLMRVFSLVMGGWPFGYWLQTQRNYFAKTMLPDSIAMKQKITSELRKAYVDPFPTPKSRTPTWVFPRQIRKARPWLAGLESKLASLADVPTQLLWGAKDDPGFPVKTMERWQRYLGKCEVEALADASHFVQEDRPDKVAAAIRRVIERTQGRA
jgi:haloalkane dehalogenase